VQSSNPVLTRLGEAARRERATGHPQQQYGQQQYGYGIAPSPAATGRVMTLDDVVVRTVALLAITGVVGAISWIMIPDNSPVLIAAVVGSALAGLVLGLVISFARITNPFVITLYAIAEGVLLGVVSKFFERLYPGIVIQAVIGTFGVFAIMAVLYKMKVLRATPRFTKMVIGALIGIMAVIVVNLIASLFGHPLGIYDSGTGAVNPWAVVFSLVCLVVGALTFILDFDAVEQGVRYGLPEKYAWYCSFGLLVGLIFVYWQILRLLSYLRR
jgi:uncharacterized YccA/Bax inhibitor family protein